MIVFIQGVKGDVARFGRVKECQGFICGQVVGAQADDAFHAGQDFLQVRAFFRPAAHVCHFSFIMPGQPMPEAVRGLIRGRRRHPEAVEPQMVRFLFYKLQRGLIHG